MEQKQVVFTSEEVSLFSKGECFPNWMYAGIDEVGVSSIAGPMVCAVVVLPQKHGIIELPRDSKELTSETIKQLALKIKEKSLYYCIVYMNHEQVDFFGASRARHKLWGVCARKIRRKLRDIKIVIDGAHPIKFIDNQEAIVKADRTHDNVSAAAIIAKDWCDQQLILMHSQYPKYNFKKNKGYLTKSHREEIFKNGICEFHRKNITQEVMKKPYPKEEVDLPINQIQDMLKEVAPLLKENPFLVDEWSLGFLRRMWKSIFIKKNQKLSPRIQFFIKKSYDKILKNYNNPK